MAHVVLFEPKASVTSEEREAFLAAIREAFTAIPSVERAIVGERQPVGASYEGMVGDVTYSYVAVVEFINESGLKAYLEHERHQRLGQLFWQTCERTLILDVGIFWLNDKKLANDAS